MNLKMKWSIIATLSSLVLTSTGFRENAGSPLDIFIDHDYMDDEGTIPSVCIRYLLYTRRNPKRAIEIKPYDNDNLSVTYIDPQKTIVFLVHGWMVDRHASMNKMLTEAFLKDDDVNVVVVDWGKLAKRNYVMASLGVVAIGNKLGSFIDWIVSRGASYNAIHLIGHSLGSHIVGLAGVYTGGRVKRITGLDPARGLLMDPKHHLNRFCAQYVEVIHTNTHVFGIEEPCGHVDFYPNGGGRMPGCILPSCSHSKAYEYMAVSVEFNNLTGQQCYNMEEVKIDMCYGPPFPMGNSDLNKFGSGIFRVNTYF